MSWTVMTGKHDNSLQPPLLNYYRMVLGQEDFRAMNELDSDDR
jgi:hypothetical protein